MKQITEKDLVDFGNYLLSKERKKLFKSHTCANGTLEERLSMVHDCDIANCLPVNTGTLPVSESLNGFNAKYYLVTIQGYTNSLAMYLEDENGDKGWYLSYTAKIIRPVLSWQEVTK